MDASRTLWLIDDDSLIRVLASKQCAKIGYEMQAFESGRDAIEALQNAEPLLIVIDKEMPGMGGLETGEAVRTKGFQGPMILWTASPNREVTATALDTGFDRVLSKAVSLKDILAELGLVA